MKFEHKFVMYTHIFYVINQFKCVLRETYENTFSYQFWEIFEIVKRTKLHPNLGDLSAVLVQSGKRTQTYQELI